jgi:hypothetical protein
MSTWNFTFFAKVPDVATNAAAISNSFFIFLYKVIDGRNLYSFNEKKISCKQIAGQKIKNLKKMIETNDLTHFFVGNVFYFS